MSDADRRKAVVLLIMSLMDQLDEIVSLRKQGHSAQLSNLLFQEIGSVLHSFDPETEEIYFANLLALSRSFGANAGASVSPDYVELTAPIKRKFVSEIQTELRVSNR